MQCSVHIIMVGITAALPEDRSVYGIALTSFVCT